MRVGRSFLLIFQIKHICPFARASIDILLQLRLSTNELFINAKKFSQGYHLSRLVMMLVLSCWRSLNWLHFVEKVLYVLYCTSTRTTRYPFEVERITVIYHWRNFEFRQYYLLFYLFQPGTKHVSIYIYQSIYFTFLLFGQNISIPFFFIIDKTICPLCHRFYLGRTATVW